MLYSEKLILFEFSYVAVAIHNKNSEMGGSAMFCFSHNFMGNLQTGVKMSKNSNSYSTILDQNDLVDIVIETIDGKMKCSFTRPKQTNVEGVEYDLANQYYLLLAQGPMKGEIELLLALCYKTHTDDFFCLFFMYVPRFWIFIGSPWWTSNCIKS